MAFGSLWSMYCCSFCFVCRLAYDGSSAAIIKNHQKVNVQIEEAVTSRKRCGQLTVFFLQWRPHFLWRLFCCECVCVPFFHALEQNSMVKLALLFFCIVLSECRLTNRILFWRAQALFIKSHQSNTKKRFLALHKLKRTEFFSFCRKGPAAGDKKNEKVG